MYHPGSGCPPGRGAQNRVGTRLARLSDSEGIGTDQYWRNGVELGADMRLSGLKSRWGYDARSARSRIARPSVKSSSRRKSTTSRPGSRTWGALRTCHEELRIPRGQGASSPSAKLTGAGCVASCRPVYCPACRRSAEAARRSGGHQVGTTIGFRRIRNGSKRLRPCQFVRSDCLAGDRCKAIRLVAPALSLAMEPTA